jgi:hypothetical protein
MQRFSLVLALLAVVALFAVASHAVAADTQEGTFVKADDKSITIKDSKDKEHTFDMAKDAKIMCDDKACEIKELKKDVKVKLTLDADKKVTKLEASTK